MFPEINYAPDDETGGGGTGGDNAGDQTQNKGEDQSKQRQENNGQDNVDNFNDLWQTSEDEDKQDKGETQTQDKKPVVNDFIKDYVSKIDFVDGVDTAKIYEGLSSGDPTALNAALSQVAQNTFKRALVDTNKLINARVDAAVETAVAKSRTNVHGDLAVQSMNAEMPFTKDPAVDPIAKAVLAQFMKKGQDASTAIANVKKFFQRTHKISSRDLGINKPPKGPGRIQNATPGNEVDDDEADEIDWMATLGV